MPALPFMPQGSDLRTFTRIHTACPTCGAPFERDNEGDFLGAMVTAYSLAVVLGAILTVLLYVLTSLPVATQMLITGVTMLLFLLAFYRNLKGVWIAVLLALLRWFRDERVRQLPQAPAELVTPLRHKVA